ncbi:MAG: Acylphosphatase [Parcubacteria bacterium OLB19]|jgi:acylphosphatase|nr:MAG: Acylphosphatase [Parcubacteria bacterium OLB19]
MIELRATITGKVQGVRFRDYVQASASELGLFGYVKNQSDGSVFVLAQGEPEVLKSLVEYLHEGSSLSQVEGVAVEWGTASVTYDDFSLLQ